LRERNRTAALPPTRWRHSEAERAQSFIDNLTLLRDIVDDSCARARASAQETMRDVREAMGLSYT